MGHIALVLSDEAEFPWEIPIEHPLQHSVAMLLDPPVVLEEAGRRRVGTRRLIRGDQFDDC